MPKRTIKQDVTEDPRYHDTWRLLKKYRDVVWSMELSVQQMKNQFQIEYGSSIEDFLDSIYLAGADLSGTELEDHARCIERSNKMLTLVNNSIELLRTRHKHGEDYYSSREVKEIGAQATMIRGSRSTGILLCGSGIYAVYNTADTRMKWEYKAEVRLKAMMQTDLCHRRLADRFMDSPPGAIVFGDGMDQLEILMGQGDKETRNYLIMNGIFRCFHYLTLDHRGEVLLRLLCDPERKAALDGILSEDLAEGRSNWLIEHDAIDGNGCPVLFGYTCDMPRIRRFDDALGLHGQTGTVYCFDFQEPALRRVCGPRVALQSIDFEAFEGSVFHIP